MFENLCRLESEKQISKATVRQEEEVCATISASDVSISIEEKEQNSQSNRPQSSNGQRRRRDQRKTPSGRASVNQLMQNAKQNVEEMKKQKRAKYTGKREK